MRLLATGTTLINTQPSSPSLHRHAEKAPWLTLGGLFYVRGATKEPMDIKDN